MLQKDKPRKESKEKGPNRVGGKSSRKDKGEGAMDKAKGRMKEATGSVRPKRPY